jgi:hypothetical protein
MTEKDLEKRLRELSDLILRNPRDSVYGGFMKYARTQRIAGHKFVVVDNEPRPLVIPGQPFHVLRENIKPHSRLVEYTILYYANDNVSVLERDTWEVVFKLYQEKVTNDYTFIGVIDDANFARLFAFARQRVYELPETTPPKTCSTTTASNDMVGYSDYVIAETPPSLPGCRKLLNITGSDHCFYCNAHTEKSHVAMGGEGRVLAIWPRE